MPPSVSVVIPTQRRPGPLALAAGSVLVQEGVAAARIELVIADNDRAPSAQAFARLLAETAPFRVLYVHEPRPGVANVRNTALAAASGDLIAFLDDDEEAPPHWLAELLRVQDQFGADAVFGPVKGRAPGAPADVRSYLEQFFSRPGIGYPAPPGAGLIAEYFGCGNSLVRRASLPGDRPFAEVRNHIGGEDDLLFAGMARAGARFAWAPQAWVWEDPAPERQTLRYALARAFAYGQGPTVAAISAGRRGRAARWMAVGAVQAVAFGALAALSYGLRRRDWPQALDRAARGLGKLLWWDWFKIGFYGR